MIKNAYIMRARARKDWLELVNLIQSFFIMIYAYIRVSTDSQTVKNQRFEISKFCERERLEVEAWVEETISGTKQYEERVLGRLLKKLKKGDLVICTELSRLGRSLYMIMEILSLCMNKGCRVWSIKEGYRLGDDIQSKVLAFAFGLSAEIERDLISSRTREALQVRKAQGVKLGRPAGSQNKSYKLDEKEECILKMLSRRTSKAEIARVCGVSRNTLERWLAKRNSLK